MIPFPFGQFTKIGELKKQLARFLRKNESNIDKVLKEIKEQQKECEHPLNEIILERDYYGPDEDSDYTHYFRCDKCGEEIETEEGE